MNTETLDDFRQYIGFSILNLTTSLDQVVSTGSLSYDMVYEKFFQIIEKFKIDMLNQMKIQLFSTYQSKSVLLKDTPPQQVNNFIDDKSKNFTGTKFSIGSNTSSQRMGRYMPVFDRLKIDKNFSPYGCEHKFQTFQSGSSVMSIGKQQLDQSKSLGDSHITPLPKVSQYQSNDSAFSKMTPLLSESAENNGYPFKTPTSNDPPVHQPNTFIQGEQITSEISADPHYAQFNSLNSFHKTDESSETEAQLQNNLNSANQRISLFEMIDVCLNSVKKNPFEKTREVELEAQAVFHSKESLTNLSVQASPLQFVFNSKPFEPTPDRKTEGRKNNYYSQNYGTISNEKELRINLSFEDKDKYSEMIQEHERDFLNKRLTRIVLKKYFKRWRRLVLVFQPQTYDDEFDLLHENIEGIEGMDGLDVTSNLNVDVNLRKILTPIENREDIITADYEQNNLLSDHMSFCEIVLTEPDRPNQDYEKSPQRKQRAIQREEALKPQMTNKDLIARVTSPKANGRTLRMSLGTRASVNQAPDKEKAKEREKRSIGLKALGNNIYKKEIETDKNEKIKIAARNSVNKTPVANVTKSMTFVRGGFATANKENLKNSPSKLVRKPSYNGTKH